MNRLVTGAAGFIGTNFVRLLAETYPDDLIIALDALTYAGCRDNLRDIESDRVIFSHTTILDVPALMALFDRYDIQQVIHFAAESHVDRSIMSADPFIQTNIVGTQRLLDVSKKYGVARFVHVSTDEVYGSLNKTDPAFTEDHPIQPNSPYSASKAGSDLLVRSYVETFGFPAMITRCSNNYGPYQFPEKLIPLMIHNAKTGQPLPVYGNGQNIRDWVHVTDHNLGVLAVLNQGVVGEVYNIGGECELTNLDIVKEILNHVGASQDLITYVKDRPGHDFRYAMNIEKIQRTLGWSPTISFADGLKRTIEWYHQNEAWLTRILSGEYRDYYKEQYQ
ncbi:MAG: dTDP-glucose 4,6-dehydratase [Candidatus Marinamargulisbacteria bacterium]